MTVIALPADMAANAAAALLPQLRQQVQAVGAGVVTLNAQAVQRFDSATLALLLECRRQVHSQNARLQVTQWPQGLLSMARAYGVDVLFAEDAVVAA